MWRFYFNPTRGTVILQGASREINFLGGIIMILPGASRELNVVPYSIDRTGGEKEDKFSGFYHIIFPGVYRCTRD